jgi:hypothetical protein
LAGGYSPSSKAFLELFLIGSRCIIGTLEGVADEQNETA